MGARMHLVDDVADAVAVLADAPPRVPAAR
jgi:hypothetical protein